MKLFVALFCGIASVFIVAGVVMAALQHHRMSTYVPVDAEVLTSGVAERVSRDSKGRTSRSYAAEISYRYAVNGRAYEADDLSPVGSTSGSRGWAQRVADAHRPGARVTAWHDPDSPADAFLVREWSFLPYFFIMFPMIHFCVGVAIGMATAGKREAPAPRPRADGWFDLPARSSVQRNLRIWGTIAALWWGATLFACGHYLAFAERPYGADALWGMPIAAAIGLVPLGVAGRYLAIGRKVLEAKVSVDNPSPCPGTLLAVKVEQAAHSEVQAEEVRVGLVCVASTRTRAGGKARVSSNACFEDWETPAANVTIRPGRPLSVRQGFVVPAGQYPTTPVEDRGANPRYDWKIAVHLKLSGPDYRGEFPLAVCPVEQSVRPSTAPTVTV